MFIYYYINWYLGTACSVIKLRANFIFVVVERFQKCLFIYPDDSLYLCSKTNVCNAT